MPEATTSKDIWHARNVPLSSLREQDVSPYADAVLLATQATEIQKRFVDLPHVPHQCPGNGVAELNSLDLAEMMACLRKSDREVLVIDYKGDTAKLTVSALRHAGIKAYSVATGWNGLLAAGVPTTK